MYKLRQQAASSERKVSTLRERLKRRHVILVLLLFVSAAVLLDTTRSPANQVTARLYAARCAYTRFWGVRC